MKSSRTLTVVGDGAMARRRDARRPAGRGHRVGLLTRFGLVALALVAVSLAAAAGSMDFYRAGERAGALFHNQTGEAVDGLVLRFSGTVAPENPVGYGANLQLLAHEGGELTYGGDVRPGGTWQVEWVWGDARLVYAAWMRDGGVVETISVHEPTALFGMMGSYAGQTITFFAPASSDPDGHPLARYLWQWSDGVVAEGVTVERTFSAGSYEVILTVWDVDGHTSSRIGRFEIEGCKLTVDVIGSGAVTQTPYEASYEYGAKVVLIPSAAPHWDFVGWMGHLTGTDNPGVVEMLGDTTVTAVFSQHPYTLSIEILGNGTVARDPDKVTYFYGEEVTLTATPEEHWDFIEWGGDLSGTSATETVTIVGDMALVANFDWHRYQLNIATVGNGTVSATPDEVGYRYGTVVTLNPQAAEGWEFGGWSGDLTGADAPASLVIVGDMDVLASFIERALRALIFSQGGDIHLINEDGTGRTNLTNNGAGNVAPHPQPGGDLIAFLSRRDGTETVYVMDADGSNVRRLVSGHSEGLTWNTTDTITCQAAGAVGDIYLMNPDGTNVRKVTTGGRWYYANVSPDGQRICAIQGSEGDHSVYIMDIDGSNLQKIAWASVVGAWSPDSRYVALGSYNDLILLDTTTMTQQVLLRGTDLDPASIGVSMAIHWSPDGQRLAFNLKHSNADRDVWMVDVTGSDPTLVLASPGDDRAGSWSPDGDKFLVFSGGVSYLYSVADQSISHLVTGSWTRWLGGDYYQH